MHFNVNNYWCRQLVLPASILKKVEQLCSRYFWKGADKSAVGARVSWEIICLSKSKGGLGLKNIKSWNRACLIRLIRKILAGDGSQWVAWLKAYVFKEQDFWQFRAAANVSWSIGRILKSRAEALPILSVGSPQVKEIWDLIRSKGQNVSWHKIIWFPLHIPKFSLIAWMALLNKLPTRDRLLRMGISTDGICVNCNNSNETRDHLFSHCSLATNLWNSILNLNGMKTTYLSWEDMVSKACSSWKRRSLFITILKLSWTAFIYSLWQEINQRIFQGRRRTIKRLLKDVKDVVGIRLRRTNINRLDSTNLRLCKVWGIV
ncbi:uncharacterized protein LOC120202813 [Hibiscus syriacus]|uniref:uncharacterized protein LOC120202813 n=1 Tax=Hibiscus syriacus TaxID=106335 RepID=UPI001923C2BA|nr:uncharacterized protein LOC120202813 [Hibiscus syriacus]